MFFKKINKLINVGCFPSRKHSTRIEWLSIVMIDSDLFIH